MNMIFRMLLLSIRSKRGRRVGPWDLGRVRFRVKFTDLDVLRHMNNGRYLSIMDLGRLDLMYRSGMWKKLGELGWYPVVVSQNITYRKSLELGQAFVVETQIVGHDVKSFYMEQRFVVKGEIYARAFVRARFLKKTGGTLTAAEVIEGLGVADVPANRMPQWVQDWSDASTLPPTRAEAPSIWPGPDSH
ncbi:acyl-CoA thioesterase [Lysinibacter cavernae]|uniref:YbgC/YbaW family acyl-CoA thioester hydrolase n=1 Tax=Lysinibacter cavernae TaxID=1640652 RepID=A0A7X5TUX7_9MICO|nr:acyl-CoA thioesterase [Lysinibacter cavernae]NIH54938.1 YbgC/YbaW family acyl-CoA thioester hydrolase [Lysinibacter cavernae]